MTASPRWTRRPEGSNWGDFGPDDQLGRLNLITPERRLAAMREVREGIAFALSLPLDHPGGDRPGELRRKPRLFATEHGGHSMFNLPLTPSEVCCDDGVVLYLQYSTQWDSLAHWGRMFDVDGSGVEAPTYYNGYRAGIDVLSPADADGAPRARRLGIERMAATGVQGRGVLVDLAREYGATRTLVDHAMLMRAIDRQGVEVRTGDMLLLHTGYGDAIMAMGGEADREALDRTGAALDGADPKLQAWIASSGIAALVSDNLAVEQTYGEARGARPIAPLHDLCLFRLGIHLGEMWWLGDLARWLGAAGRHAFLLTAPPLRLPGAVGSPATPVATV